MFINAGFAIKVEWQNIFKFVVQIFYNMGAIKSIVSKSERPQNVKYCTN